MQFCSGVKVDLALLAALAVYDTFPFFKVDIPNIQAHQFANAHPRGVKQIDNRYITGYLAIIPQTLDVFVGNDFLDGVFALRRHREHLWV